MLHEREPASATPSHGSRRRPTCGSDLANGEIDEDGSRLVCPWHQSRYYPGQPARSMVVGPQAGYEKVPGLDSAFIQLTKLWPLRRAEVMVERGGKARRGTTLNQARKATGPWSATPAPHLSEAAGGY